MNVAIEIIDMLDSTHVLQDRAVQYSSVVLSWLGSDDRDQNIIGSALVFSLLDETSADGYYKDLYTYNENRFKVVFTNTDANQIIWQGFLLSETYQEPWTNNNVFVNLSATDGLGLLKGKYFDDVDYQYEYSVVELLTSILRSTGLEMDLCLSPAIENKHQKDYNLVYIDLADYVDDKGVKSDLYTILNKVLYSMLCTIYQQNGVWYVEGINKRHVKEVNYNIYNSNGVFVENKTIAKAIRKYKMELTPVIGIMPPIGVVSLESDKQTVLVPENLTEEKTGVVGFGLANQYMVASAWQQHSLNFAAMVNVETNMVFMETTAVYNSDNYITVKNPMYVSKGDRIKLECLFLAEFQTGTGSLIDVLKYEILIGDQVVFSSEKDAVISYNDDGTPVLLLGTEYQLVYDFVANVSGVLNIKLWQPVYVPFYDTLSSKIYISEINIDVANDVESEYLIQSNENYTSQKDIQLPVTVDVYNTVPSFLLEKQKEYAAAEIEYTATILYGFSFAGKNYAVFNLYDLSVIKNNADFVFVNGVQLTTVELYFNFQQGDQMVLVTDSLLSSVDVVTVKIKPLILSGSKDTWLDFTDAVYPIALDSYEETVLTVYQRLYGEVCLTLDATAYGIVNFGDLLEFYYDKKYRNFYMVRLDWDVINGRSSFNSIENIYNGVNDVVDVPVVEAGNNITVTAINSVVNLTAVVQSNLPYTVLWEDISNIYGSGLVFGSATNLETTATNFLLSSGKLRVTVTNSNGVTATDDIDYVLNKEVDNSWVLNSELATPHTSLYMSGSPIPTPYFGEISTAELKFLYDGGYHPGNQSNSPGNPSGFIYRFGKNSKYNLSFPELPADVLLRVQLSVEVFHDFIIARLSNDASIYDKSSMRSVVNVYRNGVLVASTGYMVTEGYPDGSRTYSEYKHGFGFSTPENLTNGISDYTKIKNLVFNYLSTDDLLVELVLDNNVGYYYVSSNLNNADRFFDEGNIRLTITDLRVLRGSVDVLDEVGSELYYLENKISNYV